MIQGQTDESVEGSLGEYHGRKDNVREAVGDLSVQGVSEGSMGLSWFVYGRGVRVGKAWLYNTWW
jgi:hypothetical protein